MYNLKGYIHYSVQQNACFIKKLKTKYVLSYLAIDSQGQKSKVSTTKYKESQIMCGLCTYQCFLRVGGNYPGELEKLIIWRLIFYPCVTSVSNFT